MLHLLQKALGAGCSASHSPASDIYTKLQSLTDQALYDTALHAQAPYAVEDGPRQHTLAKVHTGSHGACSIPSGAIPTSAPLPTYPT